MYRKSLRDELTDKEFRDAFVESRVRCGIALQTRAIREQRGLSQSDLGSLMGINQPAISRIENPDSGNLTTTTLLSLARALDVCLVVRFVGLDRFLKETDLTTKALRVPRK